MKDAIVKSQRLIGMKWTLKKKYKRKGNILNK